MNINHVIETVNRECSCSVDQDFGEVDRRINNINIEEIAKVTKFNVVVRGDGIVVER